LRLFVNASLFILSVVFLPTIVGATELFEQHTSIRALGMGNAYLGVVENADALFYNPAGLARVSGLNWLIADPRVGLNGEEVLTTVADIQDATTFEDTIQSLYGDHVWVGGGAKTAVTLPYLGFAIYDALDASLDINNPMYPNLDISVVNDYGYALGAAVPILPVLHMGAVIKYIQRTGARVPFGPTYISSLSPDTIIANVENKGEGYSLDLGMNLLIPGPISPVLSFVWKNVGVTKFEAQDITLSAPPNDRDEMSIGAALNVDLIAVSVRPVFDFKYLNREDVQLGKKIHFGVELGLPLIDIRAGFSEGYYTIGAGLNLGIIRMDAASYGVELGEYPGQREDRRYALQFTMELGFDPSLGFLGGGGGGSGSKGGRGGSSSGWGGRGLKQRR
jgi:hypothetical protein